MRREVGCEMIQITLGTHCGCKQSSNETRSEEVRGQTGDPLPVTLCNHIWLLLARVGEDIATVT